jgi:hypothetical protein
MKVLPLPETKHIGNKIKYKLEEGWSQGRTRRWRHKVRKIGSYSNVAVGLDMIHPKATNRSSFTKKLLHSFQSERAHKSINS